MGCHKINEPFIVFSARNKCLRGYQKDTITDNFLQCDPIVHKTDIWADNGTGPKLNVLWSFRSFYYHDYGHCWDKVGLKVEKAHCSYKNNVAEGFHFQLNCEN